MDKQLYPLIDGGVFVNNPTLCAYSEARTWKFDTNRDKPTASQMMILSLGTGGTDKSFEYRKAKDWGAVQWIVPIIDIMMSGVAETVDYQLKQISMPLENPTSTCVSLLSFILPIREWIMLPQKTLRN